MNIFKKTEKKAASFTGALNKNELKNILGGTGETTATTEPQPEVTEARIATSRSNIKNTSLTDQPE